MKGSIKYYKENRWRIRLYWKGQRVQIYRNKRGEVLEGEIQAQKAWIQLNQEIEDKIFNPSEWTKEKPFLLKNAFEIFQRAKQCGEEWRYARNLIYKNHIKSQFGNMDIREITTTHVNQFHGHLIKKGLKGKTIKNILGVLRFVLRFNGMGQKIIWPVIEIQAEPVKWLTREQQETIMQYLDEEDKTIFRFLQITGCRSSEACALQRDDIDWDQRIIVIRHSMGLKRRVIEHTKTSRIKIIPISIFEEYASILKPKEVTPFIFNRDGRPYHSQRLQRAWVRTVKKAQQKYPVPSIHVKNAFRHSMASQLINAGVPIQAISKMLGHSSINVTEKAYANLMPETAWKWRRVIPLEKKRVEDLLQCKTIESK